MNPQEKRGIHKKHMDPQKHLAALFFEQTPEANSLASMSFSFPSVKSEATRGNFPAQKVKTPLVASRSILYWSKVDSFGRDNLLVPNFRESEIIGKK